MAKDYDSPNLPLADLISSPNIAKILRDKGMDDLLGSMGSACLEGYVEDRKSRAEWEERMARTNELALQVYKEKSFPWTGASNIKVPLVTIAALQYQALAYPAIIEAPDLVKVQVYGDNPGPDKLDRAERIATHMSWQNLEQDDGWEDAHDKALLIQGLAGCAFTKRIFDPVARKQVTRCVLPNNFVVNYYTQDLATSQRYTEVYCLTNNAIRTRELDGRFIAPLGQDEDEGKEGYSDSDDLPNAGPQGTAPDPVTEMANRRQGFVPPPISEITPYETGEQYCWWDLDGDDFEEPYIVTFDIGTGFVRRIVARYLPSTVKMEDGNKLSAYAVGDGFAIKGKRVIDIQPVDVYTMYGFIPSPDGGFYPIGLGQLLGDINEAANTAANQLFDASTMYTLGGGFLGRGFKGRGGPFSFKPFEWFPVDSPGDDLRKQILPLPLREPSQVLMQLFQFLLSYADRVMQTTEIGMGENPGQNTPANTTAMLDANSRRMINAIFKRTWRSFRDEYRIQFKLNAMFLEHDEDYQVLSTGRGAVISADDYKAVDNLMVCPAADPFIVSDSMKAQRAMALLQMSQQLPGFNRYRTGLRALKAMKVQDIEEVYPPLGPQVGPDGKPVMGPDGKPQMMQDFPPPPPDARTVTAQAQMLKAQTGQSDSQAEQVEMRVKLMTMVQESAARVENLQAQAKLYLAQSGATAADPFIKMIYAQIESEGRNRDQMLSMINTMMDAKVALATAKAKESGGTNTPAVPSSEDMVNMTNGQMLGSLQ